MGNDDDVEAVSDEEDHLKLLFLFLVYVMVTYTGSKK